MRFKTDQFTVGLKQLLRQKSFRITENTAEDVYQVTNGEVSFSLDVRQARVDYERFHDLSQVERLLQQKEMDFAAKYRLASYKNAQSSLRLLLLRDEMVSADTIGEDYGGGLKRVVAFVTENQSVIPLSSLYMKKWGVPQDVLLAVGERNMTELLKQTPLEVSEVGGRIKMLEFAVENPRLRAALMLAGNFRRLVSEHLGNRFLVVAPAVESMVAVQDVTNNIVESFGPVVLEEFKQSSCPLSTDVLLFSPQGISIAGRFR